MKTFQADLTLHNGRSANPGLSEDRGYSDFTHFPLEEKVYERERHIIQQHQSRSYEKHSKKIIEAPVSPPSNLIAIDIRQPSSSIYMNESNRRHSFEISEDWSPSESISEYPSTSEDQPNKVEFHPEFQRIEGNEGFYPHETSSLDPNLQSPYKSNLLFMIYLEKKGGGEMISIYDDEHDYEAFIEEICRGQNICEATALHFKINLLNMIHAVHPNPARVEVCLNKLLDLNYKRIMQELEPEAETLSLEDFYDENEDCNESTYHHSNSHSLDLSQSQI